MDGHPFDQIARFLAGGLSRRQSIKAVLGGLVTAEAVSGRSRRTAAVTLTQDVDDTAVERIADLALGTLAVLGVMDEGLDYVSGTVYRTEEAFARLGATSQNMAPLIFGEAGARNVRVESFFAPDGTHNVYVYLIETPRAAGVAENLARRLAEQTAQPNAEDVAKSLAGWDVNLAQRFSFPTEQGNLSRIQAVAAVEFLVALIVDDRYGDRKNSVTLHRNMLNALATVFPSGFDPESWDETLKVPGAALAGLVPIVGDVAQFSWVPVARDGKVISRYNVDSDQTAQTLGGAINAFNASYVYDRNGVAHNVFAAVREYADEQSAQEFADNYEEHLRESDERINARRQRVDAALANPFLVEAIKYAVAWNPAEDVRLIGSDLLVVSDLLVIDLAMFVPYDGDAETFANSDPADLDQHEELINLSAEVLGHEPTPMERHQSSPGDASFPLVPIPTGDQTALSQEEEPAVTTGPTGFANIAGGLLYQPDFATLEGEAVRRAIFKGSYYDLSAGEIPNDSRGLAEMLLQAGLEDVACLRVGDLNEAGELIEARTSAMGWALTPDRAFDAFEETRDFLSIFAERPLAVPDAFGESQYYATVINGSAIGPSFPVQATVAVAQIGTVVVGFAVEGDDESLVERGAWLMYDRLLKNDVPGGFLSRLIVLPEGDDWSPKCDLTYACLEGVIQFPLGLTDDETALFARRNEGTRNVLQARSEYATGRNDAAAGLDLQIRSYYDADAARAFFESYDQDFEDDFGIRLTSIDVGNLISGSDQSRVFLSSQEREDGVRDDALLVIAQTGPYVPILRLGLKTASSADDVRDAFLRDAGGSLAEEGKAYMTEQIRVLNDDEPGVFRARPVYSFL